jgi:polyhydroxybutyrate depolymerase
MKRLLCFLPLVGLSLASCATASDDDSALEAKFGSETIGGDRPARVVVPSSYDGITPLPLFFLLHGYTVNADIQDAYFRLSSRVDEDNFLLVLPNGTLDETGTTFWNSWSESTEPVDDVSYLMGLLDEMEDTWQVDSSRVYFLGHSNGGYMSYRLACEHADRITGMLNLAGLSAYSKEADCQASEPVSLLHVHGTLDETVPYDGYEEWLGAEEVTDLWVERDGCDPGASTEGEPLDLIGSLEGAETTVRNWTSGCLNGSGVSFWKMESAGHSPFFNKSWSENIVAWMLEHSKESTP